MRYITLADTEENKNFDPVGPSFFGIQSSD